MVSFFLATGVRLGTLMKVRIEDLDFGSGLIFIRTAKNRRQQYIPMAENLMPVLKEYLQYRHGEPADLLFCNAYGKPLTENSIRTCVRKHNKNRGVERSSVHAFRHTFGKAWVLSGGDPYRLQDIFGHSTLHCSHTLRISATTTFFHIYVFEF